MDIPSEIRAIQEALHITADGKAGPETWGAIYAAILTGTLQKPVEPSGGLADDRSEKVIATLHDKVKPYARALYHQAREAGIQIEILSGGRTYDEQAELYAQGRTKPGRVVTNAPPGYSNHNFSLAFDIGVFENGKYIPESPLYKRLGAMGEAMGLVWGGSWTRISDEPHFEIHPAWAAGMSENEMIAELRHRHDDGKDAFTA